MEIADDNSQAKLQADIDQLALPTPNGGTNLVGAFTAMHDMFRADPRFINKAADSKVRFVGIIITDGDITVGPGLTTLKAVTKAAHDDGIYTISIGTNVLTFLHVAQQKTIIA